MTGSMNIIATDTGGISVMDAMKKDTDNEPGLGSLLGGKFTVSISQTQLMLMVFTLGVIIGYFIRG